MIPFSRTSALRLGALALAGVTALPALPAAAASGARPANPAPATRAVDLACPADRVQGVSFADTAGTVHGESISCLSWYGIAKGGADGSFGVGRAVTRAQLATFLTRVLDEAGVARPQQAEDAFTDDNGSAHEASLNTLAALGVVRGAGDGTVSPDEEVSREQMASFLVRLLELVREAGLAEVVDDFFSDDDDSVHQGAINALAGLGIAAGKAGGIFDPTSDVLREQMATFLMRLVDRLVEKGDVRVPATLLLSAEEVAPGDVVDATVLGDGITSVTLAGCGFDGPVTDLDAEAEGVQFTLTVPTAWPAEADEQQTGEEGATEHGGQAGTDGGAAQGGTQASEQGDGEDSCEFVALVTFEDESTEELEGELEFAEREEAEGEEAEGEEAEGEEAEGEELEDEEQQLGEEEDRDAGAAPSDVPANDEQTATA